MSIFKRTVDRILLIIVLCVAVRQVGDANDQRPPMWFFQGDKPISLGISEGLSQDTKGNLIYSGKILRVSHKIEHKLVAAIYYPDEQILMTVDNCSTVSLYEMKTGVLHQQKTWSPKDKSRIDTVYFTKVPGLMYICYIDLATEKQLKKEPFTQIYADRFARVAFYDTTDGHEGIPLNDSSWQEPVRLLDGYYYQNSRITMLHNGKKDIKLVLTDPLDEPFPCTPKSFHQAVFVFPDKGIVSKTKNGWSLNKSDGSLIKWFSTKSLTDLCWNWPTYNNGRFIVHGRNGPDDIPYEMNTSTGRLVKVK